MQNLDLNSELLKPLKRKLENSIDILTKNAILTGKEAEITLKINVSVTKKDRKFNDEIQEYLQPSYDYQIAEKIKEAKGSYKGHLGMNYQVEIDEKNNITKIKEINKQTSMFEEGE